MKVPFGDLVAQHAALQPELDAAVAGVLASSGFIGGPDVAGFEAEFAEWQGAQFAIGCANGTDAIYIVLKSLGIGLGDEVITTAHSWISTAEAITQTGATVRFVDVDRHYHLEPSHVEAAVTHRTRAIIGVHLFGQPFDGPALKSIADRHGLFLIEDSAQAHGAALHGDPVGSWGTAATFSFFPGKNLGAWGDAGAILTNDADLARACKVFARHGGLSKHDHEIPGINSRLDAIHAAVLRVKLRRVKDWNARRSELAEVYFDGLRGLDGIELPAVRPGSGHVWHLFVIQVPRRDALQQSLADAGIATGIHYPRALPFTRAYQPLGYRPAELRNAARNQERILSLPLYPEMTDEQALYVIHTLRGLLDDAKAQK